MSLVKDSLVMKWSFLFISEVKCVTIIDILFGVWDSLVRSEIISGTENTKQSKIAFGMNTNHSLKLIVKA